MKFQQHIDEYQIDVNYESTRLKSIKLTDAPEILISNCKKALLQFQKSKYIERWSPTAMQTDVGFLDSTKLPPRLSRNTQNYYTRIINDDPLWKGYPRRQVICTLRKGREVQPDTVKFIIFPYDSTKIGVCSTDDMWDSFARLRTYRLAARRYNDFIERLFNGGSKGPNYDKSLEQMKSRCKKFDKAVDGDISDMYQHYIDTGYTKSVQTLKEYKGDLYKNILYFYNPQGFKIATASTLSGHNMAEVWFEGPAIFINSSQVKGIIDKVTLQ